MITVTVPSSLRAGYPTSFGWAYNDPFNTIGGASLVLTCTNAVVTPAEACLAKGQNGFFSVSATAAGSSVVCTPSLKGLEASLFDVTLTNTGPIPVAAVVPAAVTVGYASSPTYVAASSPATPFQIAPNTNFNVQFTRDVSGGATQSVIPILVECTNGRGTPKQTTLNLPQASNSTTATLQVDAGFWECKSTPQYASSDFGIFGPIAPFYVRGSPPTLSSTGLYPAPKLTSTGSATSYTVTLQNPVAAGSADTLNIGLLCAAEPSNFVTSVTATGGSGTATDGQVTYVEFDGASQTPATFTISVPAVGAGLAVRVMCYYQTNGLGGGTLAEPYGAGFEDITIYIGQQLQYTTTLAPQNPSPIYTNADGASIVFKTALASAADWAEPDGNWYMYCGSYAGSFEVSSEGIQLSASMQYTLRVPPLPFTGEITVKCYLENYLYDLVAYPRYLPIADFKFNVVASTPIELDYPKTRLPGSTSHFFVTATVPAGVPANAVSFSIYCSSTQSETTATSATAETVIDGVTGNPISRAVWTGLTAGQTTVVNVTVPAFNVATTSQRVYCFPQILDESYNPVNQFSLPAYIYVDVTEQIPLTLVWGDDLSGTVYEGTQTSFRLAPPNGVTPVMNTFTSNDVVRPVRRLLALQVPLSFFVDCVPAKADCTGATVHISRQAFGVTQFPTNSIQVAGLAPGQSENACVRMNSARRRAYGSLTLFLWMRCLSCCQARCSARFVRLWRRTTSFTSRSRRRSPSRWRRFRSSPS
jgi:hypothetical protein